MNPEEKNIFSYLPSSIIIIHDPNIAKVTAGIWNASSTSYFYCFRAIPTIISCSIAYISSRYATFATFMIVTDDVSQPHSSKQKLGTAVSF